MLDGVYTRATTDAAPVFHPLQPPTDAEIATLLERLHARVHRLLRRAGAACPTNPAPSDPVAEQLPLLAGNAAASIQERVATGRSPSPGDGHGPPGRCRWLPGSTLRPRSRGAGGQGFAGSAAARGLLDGLSPRGGLRDFGYGEGRNVILEYRWVGGSNVTRRELAAELAPRCGDDRVHGCSRPRR